MLGGIKSNTCQNGNASGGRCNQFPIPRLMVGQMKMLGLELAKRQQSFGKWVTYGKAQKYTGNQITPVQLDRNTNGTVCKRDMEADSNNFEKTKRVPSAMSQENFDDHAPRPYHK